MRIAVTVSGVYQVSQNEFRDWNKTKIFEETDTFKDVIEFGRIHYKDNFCFSELKFSEVIE